MLIALTIQVRAATSAPRATLMGPMAAIGALNDSRVRAVPAAATPRVAEGDGVGMLRSPG
jgi:hypothetical protein